MGRCWARSCRGLAGATLSVNGRRRLIFGPTSAMRDKRSSDALMRRTIGPARERLICHGRLLAVESSPMESPRCPRRKDSPDHLSAVRQVLCRRGTHPGSGPRCSPLFTAR
jgi:hypothetical protein